MLLITINFNINSIENRNKCSYNKDKSIESGAIALNESKVIKSNSLSEEERKRFKKELMTILQKFSKEEIVRALNQLKNKVV